MSKLLRNVPFLTSIEVSPFLGFDLVFSFRRWPCPQRSPAEPEGRSAQGAAEGKANDGGLAALARLIALLAFLSAARPAACRQG